MGLVTGRNLVGRRNERDFGPSGGQLIPRRTTGYAAQPATYINEETAMRQSAVWACLRLRANLVSTMPFNCFMQVGDQLITVPKPPILVNPDGDRVDWIEWCYSSQIELDRSGNFIGIIMEKLPDGRPNRIHAVPSSQVSVKIVGGELDSYNIGGTRYDPDVIWHEKQYTLAGSHVGLSPIAYAAYTLGEYESVRQFTTDWFSSGAVPRARLKNVNEEITDEEALLVKESWRASIQMGEPFVHGADWDYEMIQAEQASADWLKAKDSDTVDIARYFDVPAALIDAAISGQSITYQNITQRNLEFLIMHLGPALARREAALSKLLLAPRYVEFDSDSLLRMDPMSRVDFLSKKIDARLITPNEARALDNRPPYTPDQYEEFFKAGLVHGKAAVMPGSPEDPNADPTFSEQFQNPDGQNK